MDVTRWCEMMNYYSILTLACWCDPGGEPPLAEARFYTRNKTFHVGVLMRLVHHLLGCGPRGVPGVVLLLRRSTLIVHVLHIISFSLLPVVGGCTRAQNMIHSCSEQDREWWKAQICF